MILLHAWVGLQKWQMSWSPPGEQSSRPGIEKWRGHVAFGRLLGSKDHKWPQMAAGSDCHPWQEKRLGYRVPDFVADALHVRQPCSVLSVDVGQKSELHAWSESNQSFQDKRCVSTSFRKDVPRCWKQLLFIQGNWQCSQTELVKTCQSRCLADTPSKAWTWAFGSIHMSCNLPP